MARFYWDYDPTTWSRNWDADDDLDDVEEQTVAAEPIVELTNAQSPKLLLIGLPSAGSVFIEGSFAHKKAIGTITLPGVARENDKVITDKSCALYTLLHTPDVLLLACHYSVPPERAYAWTRALFSAVSPRRVVILDSLSSVRFQTSEANELPPLLRKIETTAQRCQTAENITDCPYLASPTIIDKSAAAILTYCQLHDIPATAYISLESAHMLEADTVKAFGPAVKRLPELSSEVLVQSPPFRDMLQRSVSSKRPSDLYI